jgi:hypothetical protein
MPTNMNNPLTIITTDPACTTDCGSYFQNNVNNQNNAFVGGESLIGGNIITANVGTNCDATCANTVQNAMILQQLTQGLNPSGGGTNRKKKIYNRVRKFKRNKPRTKKRNTKKRNTKKRNTKKRNTKKRNTKKRNKKNNNTRYSGKY